MVCLCLSVKCRWHKRRSIQGSYWEATSILLCSEAFQRMNGSYQVIVNLRPNNSNITVTLTTIIITFTITTTIIITIIGKKANTHQMFVVKIWFFSSSPTICWRLEGEKVTLNPRIFLFPLTNTKSELDTHEMVNLSGTESSPLITGLSIELYGNAT